MTRTTFIILLGVALLALSTAAQETTAEEAADDTGTVTTNQAHEIVRRLYREILHRKPDGEGLRAHSHYLCEGGKDEAWLRDTLLQSPERKELVSRQRATWVRRGTGIGLGVVVLVALGLLFRRFPPVARGTLKVFGILLITLVLTEIAFRTYHHFHPLNFFYSDSYNRFRATPFSPDWQFRLNSKGFKDLEYSETKTAACRVLGIGDSFAFGVVPYRFNYHTLLEERLRERGLDVEVINMGIPSIGPVSYLNLLVREGLDLDPDMVVVSFFTGNDPIEAVHDRAGKREWYEYSFVSSFLYFLVRVKPHYEARPPKVAAVYDDNAAMLSEEAFLDIEYNRSYVCRRDSRQFRRDLAAALIPLAEMYEICRRRDIGFLVLIIPDELQVNRNLQHIVMARSGTSSDPGAWDWSQPGAALAAELEKMGVAHIDLYPAFSEASAHQSLYRPRDTHWNIAGNKLAARILVDYVASTLP